MAVELLGYPNNSSNMKEQMAIEEAASAGLKSMEHLIRAVQTQRQQQDNLDCREIADFTVSKFRKVISILDRAGHARFRRAPVQPVPGLTTTPVQSDYTPQTLSLFSGSTPARTPMKTLDLSKPSRAAASLEKEAGFSLSTSGNSSSTTFVSSITGEGSVSNGGKGGNNGSSMFVAPAVSAGKPPLSGKRCRDHHDHHSNNVSGKASGGSTSTRCHCTKKRKSKAKRTIRVPAISSKVADIPADEYSWRKYGQKPIKGSPYPRGYYKCSAVRGCPARKHVERAIDDPTMLIVTYEGEHRHNQGAVQETPAASGGASTPQMMVFASTA